MSKKSFRDNPALQFMSKGEAEGSTEIREVKEIREIQTSINHAGQPRIIFEAKSKRFNMLIRPSVFSRLKKRAEIKGTSVNDLMHTIIEAYVDGVDV